MIYIVEEHVLGVAVGFGISSSINGSHEMFGCEFLCLSRISSIKDGALRFAHIAHEEETSRNACHLIFIGCSRCVHVSNEVNWCGH